ncbi:MAG: hypothetical protein V1670_05620 [Candidatus Omnitrophota bacterium]
MEKAIHITNLRNLKYFRKGKYQRIYWGIEFCQNLIPSLTDTEKILRFAKENSLNLSFVSPFVTEQGLRRLNKMFEWFRKQRVKNLEIVVNDWGVLECLNREFNGFFEIALGRLLVRQQRDPVTKSVLEKQPPFAIRGKDGKIHIVVHKVPDKQYQDGARQSYVNSPLVQDLLAKFGVKRVELNSLLQGLNLEGIRFKKSLYTPFVNISTGRFCPMETRFQKIYRINVCKRECQKYYDILRNRAIPKIIYKRGNTTFYKNSVDVKQIKKTDIDRVIYQPELPF